MPTSASLRSSGNPNNSPSAHVLPTSSSNPTGLQPSPATNVHQIPSSSSSFSEDVDMAIKLRELQTSIFEAHLHMEAGSAKIDPIHEFDSDNYTSHLLDFHEQDQLVHSLSTKVNDLMDVLAMSTSHYREKEYQRELENKYLNEGLRLYPMVGGSNTVSSNSTNTTTNVNATTMMMMQNEAGNLYGSTGNSNSKNGNSQGMGTVNDYTMVPSRSYPNNNMVMMNKEITNLPIIGSPLVSRMNNNTNTLFHNDNGNNVSASSSLSSTIPISGGTYSSAVNSNPVTNYNYYNANNKLK